MSVASQCGWLTPAPDEKYTITKRGEERRGYLISANAAFADVTTLFDDWGSQLKHN